jgi:hypothetical protein
MVTTNTSSSFDAQSYLDQIKGNKPTATPKSTGPGTLLGGSGNATQNNSQPVDRPVDRVELTQNALDLLNASSSASRGGRILSNLFDSSSSLSGNQSSVLRTALFELSSNAPVNQVLATSRLQSANDRAANSATVQKAISAYNSAQNATSNAARQNVAEAVKAIAGSLEGFSV